MGGHKPLLPLGLAIEFTQRKSADATPIASQKARLILALVSLRRQRLFCLEEGSVSHYAHAWSISILPVGSIESSSLLKPFLRRDRRAKLDSKCFREAAATGINGLALKANLSSLASPRRRRRMALPCQKRAYELEMSCCGRTIKLGREVLVADQSDGKVVSRP